MSVSAQSVAAAAAPSPSSTAPVTRNFKWDVEYIMWAPDCQQSVMIGINGRFPGPTISANAGDLIRVEVTNSLHTKGGRHPLAWNQTADDYGVFGTAPLHDFQFCFTVFLVKRFQFHVLGLREKR